MKALQAAIAAYLEQAVGIPTVEEKSLIREYPLLAVSVREDGTTLLDGGRQAEHRYHGTVTAAADRDRTGNTELLSQVTVALLRGIPVAFENGAPVSVTHGAPAGFQRSESGGESAKEEPVKLVTEILQGPQAATGSSGGSELSTLGESERSEACEQRVLHPLDIQTEGEELTFALCLCVALPPVAKPGQTEPGIMETLHMNL